MKEEVDFEQMFDEVNGDVSMMQSLEENSREKSSKPKRKKKQKVQITIYISTDELEKLEQIRDEVSPTLGLGFSVSQLLKRKR